MNRSLVHSASDGRITSAIDLRLHRRGARPGATFRECVSRLWKTSPSPAEATWVTPLRRRNSGEYRSRSRSRWNGVRGSPLLVARIRSSLRFTDPSAGYRRGRIAVCLHRPSGPPPHPHLCPPHRSPSPSWISNNSTTSPNGDLPSSSRFWKNPSTSSLRDRTAMASACMTSPFDRRERALDDVEPQ